MPEARQVAIIPLTIEKSINYLREEGITDQRICQTIAKASQGIPFHLQVGLKTWQDRKKQRQPKPEDFAQNLSEALSKQSQAWYSDEQPNLSFNKHYKSVVKLSEKTTPTLREQKTT